jgi:hypothetical protein
MINKENISIDCFIDSPIIIPSTWSGYDVERQDHLMYAITRVNILGDVLEFGVSQGKTITQIANFLTDRKIWGFDSFEGLPEDWLMVNDVDNVKFPKGSFAVENVPLVPNNVKLVKGLFENTILEWKQVNFEPVAMLHVDCDLYSSTKEVLTQLNSQIVPGTILVFDDMYIWNNPDKYERWHQGEYRALKEWLEDFDRGVEILSRNNYMQCAVRVLK